MNGLRWVALALCLAAFAGCANQQVAWEDPYMQARTGPQPPTTERVSAP